jgi:hypothetical protein
MVLRIWNEFLEKSDAGRFKEGECMKNKAKKAPRTERARD